MYVGISTFLIPIRRKVHFSDEHEGLISLLGYGNSVVPHEKLMSIDMLIIQLGRIAAELWSSSFQRKCVPLSYCQRGDGLLVLWQVAPQLAHLVLKLRRWYNLRM